MEFEVQYMYKIAIKKIEKEKLSFISFIITGMQSIWKSSKIMYDHVTVLYGQMHCCVNSIYLKSQLND